MFIITADIPSTPNYAIERDVSMLEVKSSKSKSKKKEMTYEEYERAMLIEICKQAEKDYLASFVNGSSAAKQAAQAQVPRLIIGILVDRGTDVSLLLANEYIENNYKIPKK